jgi:hypothetical protein
MCDNSWLVLTSFPRAHCEDERPGTREFFVWTSQKKPVKRKRSYAKHFLVLLPDASLAVFPGASPAQSSQQQQEFLLPE